MYFIALHIRSQAIFTARKRSLGQGNIFAPVCHSVHRGYASVHAGIPPPPEPGTPPGPGTPQDHAPPWDHAPPGTMHTPPDQAPPRPGTPLGACTPPRTIHPHDHVHPLDQAPAGPGTPPGPGTPQTSPLHPQPAQSMLGDTVTSRAVRILLKCNLVSVAFDSFRDKPILNFLSSNVPLVCKREYFS